MKQYKEYKDSGVDWIGLIPHHWKLYKSKFMLSFQTTPSKSPNKIGLENIESGTGRFIETDSIFEGNGVKFLPGDIVYGKLRPYLQKVWLATFEGNAVGDFFVFRVKQNLQSRFVYYIMLSDGFTNESNGSTFGAKMPRVSSEFILNMKWPCPPLHEQKSIADYLDEKCGKIDSMIEQIDKKIALYQRLRHAIITKTVTKGLETSASLRPSGVKWIGEIPMHWEVERFGYIAWIRARLGWKGLKADEYVESGYLFLSAFNIVNDKMNWENLNYINQFRYEESPEIMLHPGDILLVKDGAGIGKCARVDSLPKGESTTNGSLAVITPFETVNYKYLHYFIISDSFNQYKDILINGMGVPHLTQGEMKKMYLPVPPIKEQEEIAEYLDKKCQAIENNIAKYLKQKELLERYRKALIAQVITGKRRVCEPIFDYPNTTQMPPAMAAEENI